MIAPDYKQLCKEAERYYYDFLSDEDRQSVPEEVINHVIHCDHCREQMDQLEKILFEAKEQPISDLSQRQTVVTSMLKLHFAYIGKYVTCTTVRPFLPSLLDPALRIKIPTPITAHLDSCEQCRDDLKRLQDLGLGPKQLRTLSQLFADDIATNEITCTTASSAIPSVVAMVFDQTDAKTLRHLSLCPNCREELYKYREMVLQQMASRQAKDNIEHNRLSCPSVTSSDIFDYCITYSIDPKKDEYAKFRKSLTSHIVCCADCLGKIQQLHRTIYGIVDRPESKVATIFQMSAPANFESQIESDNLYIGFPVKVEVANLKDVQVDQDRTRGEKLREPVKLQTNSNRIRPLLKVALPVAAVIALAVGLLFNLPAAKALTIKQIYTAIDMVKNIHIARFAPDKQKPEQEIWIARSTGLYLTKTESELTLWNVSNSVKKTKILNTGATEQTSLNGDIQTSVRAKIHGSLDIMPFNTSSDIPADATWSEITDFDSRTIADNTKVYELKWFEKTYYGATVQRHWRVFVDTSTSLPKKIQWFRQSPSDTEPVLELTMLIEYPSDQQLQSIVADMSP